MRYLFTLLLATAAAGTTLQAQSTTTEKAKDVIRGERRDYDPNNAARDEAKTIIAGRERRTIYERDNYPSGNRGSRDEINRDYDAKIRSIRNNPRLSAAEKARIIRGLEADRDRRLGNRNGDYRRYEERSGKYKQKDKKDRYKEAYKRKDNNGKHLGWQKGKGNPHRWN